MENSNPNRLINGRSFLYAAWKRLSPPVPEDMPWLSAFRLADQLLVLRWILFRPQRLKTYQRRLNNNGRFELRRLGGWVVSSLIWIPLLLWYLFASITGRGSSHWYISLLLSATFLIAWWVIGQWNRLPESGMGYVLIISSFFLSFMTEVLALNLLPNSIAALGVILLGYMVLLCLLAALAVAQILNLKMAQCFSIVCCLSLGGCLLIAALINGVLPLSVIFLLTLVTSLLPHHLQHRFVQAKAINPFP